MKMRRVLIVVVAAAAVGGCGATARLPVTAGTDHGRTSRSRH